MTFPSLPLNPTGRQTSTAINYLLNNPAVTTVTQLGALGDGTTDDTVAIQNAINSNPNKRIVFPPGRYLITSAINITQAPVTLDFSHGRATLVLGTQNMNGIVIGDGTDTARNAVAGTRIIAPEFNVKSGLAAFTTGSCIYRNYVYDCDVINPKIYGADGATKKLWKGIYDYRVSESDAPNARISFMLSNGIHAKGDGTTAGRTVDCNYDNLRITDCVGDHVFVDDGCAGLGFYRPIIYSVGAGVWGIHINSTVSNGGGQNFFIDMPDIEASAGTAGAIYLESGDKAILNKGWIGASMGIGLRVGTSYSGVDVSTNFEQSKVLIEGPQCMISGGEIVGDNATAAADGLTIKGNNCVVGSSVKIRQWLGKGIAWGGTTPSNVCISVPKSNFNNNGTDVESPAGLANFSIANGHAFTVAQLPTGASGMRLFVTDATATTFASTVAGSGTNKVPVYHDGTSWKIG